MARTLKSEATKEVQADKVKVFVPSTHQKSEKSFDRVVRNITNLSTNQMIFDRNIKRINSSNKINSKIQINHKFSTIVWLNTFWI